MKRRHLILLLGGTGAGSLTVGSGAFSSATADRNVEVNIAPDDAAPIGYSIQADRQPSSGLPEIIVPPAEQTTRTLVTIKNSLAGPTRITDVEINTAANGAPQLADVEWDTEPFSPGSSAHIRGTIDCTESEGGPTTVGLTVEITAPTVDAEVFGNTDLRQFQLRCEPSKSLPDLTDDFRLAEDEEEEEEEEDEEEEDEEDEANSSKTGQIVFNGLGTVKLEHLQDGTVDVQLYLGDESGVKKSMSVKSQGQEMVRTNKPIGGGRFQNESIVAVRIAEDNAIYIHPSWDQDQCQFEKGAGGTVTTPQSIREIDPRSC